MRIRYQASFFADLGRFTATPENTLALLSNLTSQGLGLLPNTVQELAPPALTPVPRMRFSSPSGDAEIVVGLGRLDIVRQGAAFNGAMMAPAADFIEFVRRSVSAIFQSHQGIAGTRLALIIQSMAGDLPAETLAAYFGRLFNAPAFYADNPPAEWTFRANSNQRVQFGEHVEMLNVISKVDRVQGKTLQGRDGWREFDSVMSEFDVNTTAENGNTRFSPADLVSFSQATFPLVDRLEADLVAQLG